MSDYGAKRTQANRYSAKNRSLTSGADVQGVSGEIAFARFFLGHANYTPRTKSKGPGWSFREQAWTIKVQTSKTPGNLLVKEGQAVADIYVLAGIREPLRPEDVFFCGWAEQPLVEAASVTVPNRGGDYVQPCHTLPRQELRPMAELARLLAARGPIAMPLRGDPAPAAEPETPAKEAVDDAPQGRLF